MQVDRFWHKLKKRNNPLFLKDYFVDDFTQLAIPYEVLEDGTEPAMIFQYRDYLKGLQHQNDKRMAKLRMRIDHIQRAASISAENSSTEGGLKTTAYMRVGNRSYGV